MADPGIITRSSADKYLTVKLDRTNHTISLQSEYSNIPLTVQGEFDLSEHFIEVRIHWDYPVDFITRTILSNIIQDKITVLNTEEAFNELNSGQYLETDEFHSFIDFIFNRKEVPAADQLADFFLQLLEHYTNAMTKLLETVLEEP
jgi:hypothetical protein